MIRRFFEYNPFVSGEYFNMDIDAPKEMWEEYDNSCIEYARLELLYYEARKRKNKVCGDLIQIAKREAEERR